MFDHFAGLVLKGLISRSYQDFDCALKSQSKTAELVLDASILISNYSKLKKKCWKSELL